jgi:hypothetical protein
LQYLLLRQFCFAAKKVERIETRDGQRKENMKAKLRKQDRETDNMKLQT